MGCLPPVKSRDRRGDDDVRNADLGRRSFPTTCSTRLACTPLLVGPERRRAAYSVEKLVSRFSCSNFGVSNHHLNHLRRSEHVLEGRLFRRESIEPVRGSFSTE